MLKNVLYVPEDAIAYGSIVPTEHAVFWTTQVNVAEVLVDVGDYVEAGQVVATADLEAAQKAKQDLEESRRQSVTAHRIHPNIKKAM